MSTAFAIQGDGGGCAAKEKGMKISALLMAASLAVPAFGAAHAQDSGRYRLEKTENGFVRMDTDTGQMSLCEQNGDKLVCRLAHDDRAAYANRLDHMQAELDALEGRVKALEATAHPASSLPSDAEVDRTLGIMDKFFRHFMGIAHDLEQQQKQADQAQPNHT